VWGKGGLPVGRAPISWGEFSATADPKRRGQGEGAGALSKRAKGQGAGGQIIITPLNARSPCNSCVFFGVGSGARPGGPRLGGGGEP